MNYKRVFWGLLLIIIGVLFVLNNINLIDVNWSDIFSLWPLLLVFWGISIIPVKDYVKIILTVLVLVIGLIIINKHEERNYFHFEKHWDEEYDDWESKELNIPYDSDLAYARLNFDAAAGEYRIQGETDNLIDFKRRGYNSDYKLLREDKDSIIIINLELDNKIFHGRRKGSKVEMKLNTTPIWEFDFNAGAASIDMDLRKYKTREINVDGGASSIELILGDEYPMTDVSIDAGAASIEIKIPETSSCELSTSTVLSSKEIKEFEKIEGGLYRTPDFSEDDNLIYISVDAAVSSLKITRY
ncbi:LiaI-LiaF-like domain-containing protein [Bacteroidota bacterium]